ncbi:MAG: hypothetical protein ACK5PR_02815, partial [bacterium]
ARSLRNSMDGLITAIGAPLAVNERQGFAKGVGRPWLSSSNSSAFLLKRLHAQSRYHTPSLTRHDSQSAEPGRPLRSAVRGRSTGIHRGAHSHILKIDACVQVTPTLCVTAWMGPLPDIQRKFFS